ncbi:MAG: hypothetical protein MJZ77_04370 [Bacteroidales bacterium]|nr:hypothetical protein [Bacteroidales bacterium]
MQRPRCPNIAITKSGKRLNNTTIHILSDGSVPASTPPPYLRPTSAVAPR